MRSRPEELFLFDPSKQIPLMPTPCRVDFNQPVSQVACGLYHTLILTQSKQIFGCGLNTNGQLGIPMDSVPDDKRFIPELQEAKFVTASGIVQISAGSNFTLALSQNGNLYSTGSGKYGIHGLGVSF